MRHWLMKSEPDVFSIEDLRRKRTAGWDGVRNFQARNNLRAMRKGDLALFYHSSVQPPCVAGVMEIVGEAKPDPTQFDPGSGHYDPGSRPDDPRWSLVEVRFLRAFERPLEMARIKSLPGLKGMVLLHNSRLSVQPVTPEEFKTVLEACR